MKTHPYRWTGSLEGSSEIAASHETEDLREAAAKRRASSEGALSATSTERLTLSPSVLVDGSQDRSVQSKEEKRAASPSPDEGSWQIARRLSERRREKNDHGGVLSGLDEHFRAAQGDKGE